MEVIFQEVCTRASSVPIVNRKERAFRPILHWFSLLWPDYIENDRHSIFIVISNNPLVCICGISFNYAVSLLWNFCWFFIRQDELKRVQVHCSIHEYIFKYLRGRNLPGFGKRVLYIFVLKYFILDIRLFLFFDGTIDLIWHWWPIISTTFFPDDFMSLVGSSLLGLLTYNRRERLLNIQRFEFLRVLGRWLVLQIYLRRGRVSLSERSFRICILNGCEALLW